jgi:hypothetical protein
MVILCDGMLRSGSTWAFNVALKLLKLCDANRRTFGIYTEDSAVLLAASKPRRSNLVIKSHNLAPPVCELCSSGAFRAIYTWRDPYDAVASCMRMFSMSCEQSIQAIRETIRLWRFHYVTQSACIIPYHTIRTDPVTAIATVSSYLSLNAGPECMSQVAEETSFNRMRQLSQKIEALDSKRVVRQDRFLYDRDSLLHQNHIRDGSMGYGARVLSREELSAIDSMLREAGFEELLAGATNPQG